MLFSRFVAAAVAAIGLMATTLPACADEDQTYSENEIVQAGADFFGVTTEAMAKAVQRVFRDQGLPDGYIKGDEGSGAFIVGPALWLGLADPQRPRAAEGLLAGPVRRLRLRRQRVEVLHAGLQSAGRATGCSRNFPGVDGSFYFVAGIGVNYHARQRHHARADAHRRRPQSRRERGLSDLTRETVNPF